jgi:hypothetical protein
VRQPNGRLGRFGVNQRDFAVMRSWTEWPSSPSLPLFFAGSWTPDLLHRLGNCQAIFQLLELRGRRRYTEQIAPNPK